MGLVSEQSLYNLNARMIELEVIPACRALWPRPDPLEPAGRRPAGRRAAEGQRRPPRRSSASSRRSRSTAPQLEAYEDSASELGEAAGRCRAGLAAEQPGRHRADHRAAHDRAADRQPARAGDHRSRTRRCSSSTRSGPARAARHPSLRLVGHRVVSDQRGANGGAPRMAADRQAPITAVRDLRHPSRWWMPCQGGC